METDLGLSATESQLLFEARGIIQDIIQKALEVNTAESTHGLEGIDSSEHAMEVIESSLTQDSEISHLNSQVLFKAKEIVYDAVAKAVALTESKNRDLTEGTCLRYMESEILIQRAHDIVNKVIIKSIKMNVQMMEMMVTESKSKVKRDSHKVKVKSDGEYNFRSINCMKVYLSHVLPFLVLGLTKIRSAPAAKVEPTESDNESDDESPEPRSKTSTKKRSKKVL